MSKRILICCVALLLPFTIFAAVTGKISGTAVDIETGEPLAGVNIIVEGTTMGAATDADGYYVILNVPVGMYSLRASYIGYKELVVQEVWVSQNLTTETNFEMERTALEFEEVIVTAERPLVEKGATYSVSITTTEQLETIPIRGTDNIIATMAGVIVQDGDIHIRGGRDDEVRFFLNGAPTVNPVYNNNVVYTIQEAVEEMQVLAGGYTADIGGANSGIVSSQLRSGGSELHGSLDIRADGFGDPEEGTKFLNTYTYGHENVVATIGGPLFSKKIRFFLAGEYANRDDAMVRYSKGFRFEDLVDTSPYNPIHDTVTVEYPDGFTPKQADERYTINGTMTFDLPIRLNLGVSYTDRRYDVSDQPMIDILNERTPYNDMSSLLLTLKATKLFTERTYLDVRLSSYYYERDRGDSWFDKDWEVWYDSSAVYNYTNGEVVYRNAWMPQYNYRFNGFPFERNGAPNDFYYHEKQNYLGIGADFVSQIGRHHELKAGFDYRGYSIRYFDLNPSVMMYAAEDGTVKGVKTYGSIEDVPINMWITSGGVDAYGFDIYGNEIDETVRYYKGDTLLGYAEGPKKPVEAALYFTDKIEFDDLIVNAGLRVDYFDPKDRELKDPANPEVDPNAMMLKEEAWKERDPHIILSPRLGFSFPVTDKTVFYTQYGKFAQMPSYQNIYFSSYQYGFQIVQQGYYFLDPVGFGLDPIKTTSYELGFRQQLGGVAALDVAAFYKNVKGLVEVIKQLPSTPTSSIPGSYDRYANGDFATNKGVEVRLNLRRWNRLAGQVHYTYTDARGTQSTSTSAHGALYFNSQMPTIINPLEYSQQHTGSVNLDYRFGLNEGGPILSGLGINLLFQFSSGHPFTYVNVPAGGQVDPYSAGVDYMLDTRDRWPAEPINSSVTPWVYFTDLRVDKTLSLGKVDATLYLIVNNLFNRKNVINVHWVTGTAESDGFLSNPNRSQTVIETNGGQQYVDMYEAINLENGQALWDAIGMQLYGHPRQIFFGIKFNL